MKKVWYAFKLGEAKIKGTDQRWPWEWERVGIPIPILTIPGNIVKENKNFHRGYIPIIPGNIGNENEEFHRGFIPTNTGNFGNGNDF